MRVRTMGEDALFRRVKAIERAKGKHAVVKMRLFARVAFLEGLEAVADDAAASLERLVAELGDPEAEDDATGAETVNEKGRSEKRRGRGFVFVFAANAFCVFYKEETRRIKQSVNASSGLTPGACPPRR